MAGTGSLNIKLPSSSSTQVLCQGEKTTQVTSLALQEFHTLIPGNVMAEEA
jgi:hypothetical protein